MSYAEDRKRGITGRVIPTDRLTNICKSIVAAQYGIPTTDLDDVRAESTLLLTRQGEYGMEYSTLIVEGVRGERIPNTNTCEVYTVHGYMTVMVSVGIPLLLQIASDEEVDLADFVRVFGGRLESNLHLAQRWVEGK